MDWTEWTMQKNIPTHGIVQQVDDVPMPIPYLIKSTADHEERLEFIYAVLTKK